MRLGRSPSVTCGSPSIEMPVAFGQTRPAVRLPVLVMVTGDVRWLSARLIPLAVSEDLFAGCSSCSS
jgi:hypothetical protein